MYEENLVKAIRVEYIDELVSQYEEMFDESNILEFKDISMLEMTKFWQASDSKTKNILKQFIRLGSQNSISSLFALLDGSTFLEGYECDFNVTTKYQDGKKIEIEKTLCDCFWAQEEEDGHINKFK